MTSKAGSVVCPCGRGVAVPQEFAERSAINLVCSCGRRVELRRDGGSWTIAATLTPERSVPISGFSREIRSDPGAERFYFSHVIGDTEIPVHIVYRPSTRVAEVKAADMKVSTLTEVDSPWDAHRRWVERFETLRGRTKPGPNRLAGAFSRMGRRWTERPT